MPDGDKEYSEQCNEEKLLKFNEETHPLTEKSCDESLESEAVSFEEAISMTGQGKFHNILQLGYGLCLVSMITEIINTAYLLPSAECDFNMTSGDKGILTAICYVGMIASSHLWGFMADIKGRKFTLVRTLLLDGICALISSFSHTYWLFLILRFFNGFFICGPSAVVYAYMGEFHSEATRSRAIMWGAVFISGAIMALPGVAWIIMSQSWSFEFPLYTYHPWRLFVIICGLPSFLTAVIFIVYLPESPKFLLSQDREEEALHVLHYMFTQNTGNDPQHYKVKCLLRECKIREKNDNKYKKKTVLGVLDLMWAQTKPLFLSPHFSRTLLGCSLMFGIYASFNGLLLWLPDMFNRLAEYGQLHPGASATVCEVISAIASNTTTSNITAAVVSSPTTLTDPVASVTSINENLTELVNETTKCSAVVAPTVFMKSLIVGGSSAFANIACVFLIAYVGKKNILVTCMLLSAISGFAILLARSTLALLILSCILEGLVMTSPIVLNNILVDIFPTHLRAMALCISMLMGRLGTVLSSSILGILLEVNCNLVFITLGGMLLVCGGLGYLLPSPWQWRVRR